MPRTARYMGKERHGMMAMCRARFAMTLSATWIVTVITMRIRGAPHEEM